MRIGIGYDIHRLEEGRTMVLGGVTIPCSKGPDGHSDGDVLIHAVCDAVLGAIGKGDIGCMFPDTDMAHKGRASIEFLKEVTLVMERAGYSICNIDCIIITETPKIALYSEQIKHVIGKVMKIDKDIISVKGKTSEKLGDIGREEAIAAHAAVLIEKKR
ncbi:MAG: 2-C-methyl-D-erythritol 2,4-cyclodiphosphate synthase [Candidatus Omnitrophota bacterium]